MNIVAVVVTVVVVASLPTFPVSHLIGGGGKGRGKVGRCMYLSIYTVQVRNIEPCKACRVLIGSD